MIDTLSIYGTYAYTLCVTSYFFEHAGLVVHSLDKLLEISSLLGSKILVDSEVQGCLIAIGEHALRSDLTVLDMGEFDVILDMNWLSTWHAT